MEAAQDKKRPKLLLADDSITIRKVVELTFAEEGVDVFSVGDGESAMKKFVEVQPDIVLVDVNMPDPTGYQICEMIKQDESTRDIPVLLLVGSFEPFDTSEAERVGADGFLTKPFQSVRELVGKVTELLGSENGIPPPPVETADIEDLFTSSFAETYRAPDGGTTDTFLGDAGMDDDLIQASRQGGPEPEAAASDEDTGKQEIVQGYDWMAEPAVGTEEPAAANGGFAPTVEAPVPADAEVVQFERVVDEFEDTLEVEEPEAEPEAADNLESTERASGPYEPSEEFINIIARRVIEKLSDKAVRDIAREAVPRITEKLIREALEQDKKE